MKIELSRAANYHKYKAGAFSFTDGELVLPTARNYSYEAVVREYKDTFGGGSPESDLKQMLK